MAPAVSGDVSGDIPPAAAARRAWTMPVVIGVLALVLRVWAPGPVTQTQDEYSWLQYSTGFRRALVRGDLAQATAGQTMPGVTTMWAGTFGYASMSVAHSVGLTAESPRPFDGPVLRASRGVVALWSSIALGALVAVATRLVSRRAAAIAGVLLATEPFLVGHSNLLHTDAMVTMFGALSIVALLAGLRARRPDERAAPPVAPVASRRMRRPQPPLLLVLISGASAGLAVLTKLNAAPLVLGAAAVVLAIEAVRAARQGNGFGDAWARGELGALVRLAGFWALAAIVVAVALWPAVWVAPREQLRLIGVSMRQLRRGEGMTFFRQHLTPDAGATYYPVAMLFRMTPWFLVGTAIALVAVLVRLVQAGRRKATADRATTVAATLLLASVPYLAVITLASQKYDRYALPLFAAFAIACGVVLDSVLRRWDGHERSTRWIVPVGVMVTALLAISTLSHAPYAISYVDPLVGGQVRARRNILLGWGEGREVLGAEIQRREGARCDDARILGVLYWGVAFPCGQHATVPATVAGLRDADYYVSYVSHEQRGGTSQRTVYREVRRTGRLIKVVRIGGVHYAELWKLRPVGRP